MCQLKRGQLLNIENYFKQKLIQTEIVQMSKNIFLNSLFNLLCLYSTKLNKISFENKKWSLN